jgi:hypothetical protein
MQPGQNPRERGACQHAERRALSGPVVLSVLAFGFACSAESGPSALTVPPPDDFALVSTALGARCGTLDCHGRVEQNLRLYGEIGLRLDAADVPGGDEATPLEHDANYQSVIALEPEVLSRVWRDGGSGADRLTIVRKARGQEAHKGGSIFAEGEAGDRCLLSWLAGATDVDGCSAAAELPPSPFELGP